MAFTSRQWLSILLVIIVDAFLAVVIGVSLGPQWVVLHPELVVPNLNLLLAPLGAIPILLVPTFLLLKIGWEDKITPRMFLFPLRLGLGYEFLHAGLEKVMDTTYLASPGLIGYGAVAAPSPWVREFMNVLAPNYVFWLLLMAWGQILIGLSLTLGGATRLGALGGVLMQWVFLFLLGWLSVSTWGLNYLGSAAFFFVGMYQGGRWLGLDQLWGPKFDESTNPVLQFFGLWT